MTSQPSETQQQRRRPLGAARQRRPVRNRLNDLDGRTWLPFQKSWFRDHPRIYDDFVAFFTKRRRPDGSPSQVVTAFGQAEVSEAIRRSGRQALAWPVQTAGGDLTATVDYALIDLRGRCCTTDDLAAFLTETEQLWTSLPRLLRPRAYLTVLVNNQPAQGTLIPIAWQLGRHLSRLLTLKDEKIGCLEPDTAASAAPYYQTDGRVYYALNFRRDDEAPAENGPLLPSAWPHHAIVPNQPMPALPSWFVPKPPPREKDVLLHPAKYPETMVAEFITSFTQPDDLVLDPMVGTGSTLVACRQTGRRGIGIELNQKYADIAQERLDRAMGQLSCADQSVAPSEQRVICADSAKLTTLPEVPDGIAYCITSPPYWDMLNMRGAMTQKSRSRRGLDVSYSSDERDAGNIEDYQAFLAFLANVYRQVRAKLRSGGYLTVVVKNVKKRSRCYPLAWDLAERLAPDFRVCAERFWCQDDVRLAPYGYGNAWVSNTLHHYCLTFQKA